MIQSILIWGVVLLVCAILGKLYFSWLVKLGKAKIADERRAEQLALRCNPAYAQMEERDRRYGLAKERQAIEWERFKLERHLALTRVQPEIYLINEEPQTITPLPSLKRIQPEEPAFTPALPLSTIPIPTFAELLASGDVGPGQRDMLFCYEMIADEQTGKYVEISPVRGEIGAMHTQFIAGGSQSGKTTYMAGSIGQAVAMGTLLYIIDPHKKHPEKSIAAKVQAFSDYFIMPPASTHDEIARLLEHMQKTRDALIQQKTTRYQGHHIMVVVDEVPALMAYQKSQDKSIKQLYINLALFMQSIGTQTAKFGMTGLYGSQFVTKDELGDIEIRDACMSQLLLRLHPTQAQAMRILGKQAVASMPKLEKGHGYLMLSDSFEPMRIASGNVTQSDLAQLARMLPPSPMVKTGKVYPVSPGENRSFRGENGSVIPIRDDVFSPETEALSPGENRSGKQIDTALQAKVDRVLEMLGENKGKVIGDVWGVAPGKSQAYQDALAEYEQVMRIIARMARKEA